MSRNLRKRARISYYEVEEPNLDEYVFCTDCGDFVFEYCAIHGALLVVPDDKVPTKSPYPPCVPRAALTIPHVFLHLARSSIPGAGIGVFSTLTLPSGVRFGPYRGKKTYEATSMYCWQIHDGNNRRSHYVDAADANNSNWMRYVNCSRHWSEQNLVAYQYRGMMYYRTIKIIPKFTELLVFYGGEFADILQINLKKYNSPLGYAQKLGALNPQKLPSIKEKPKDSSKISKEKTLEQSKLTLQDQPKQTNVKNKDTTTNKRNKINNETKNTNKKPKIDRKKTKKFKPPKRQENLCVINQENSVNDTATEKNECNQNIKLANDGKTIINESKLNKFPKKSVQNADHNDNKYLISNNKFICNICQYETTKKINLIFHLRVHDNGGKVYACDYCKYITNEKRNLSTHVGTHTGVKLFACEICNKKFTHSGHLQSHFRIHNGEKPFQCQICSYKCTQLSDLKKHLRIHTGEKPFQCKICSYKCTQLGRLQSHTRIHTGEKPFQCQICFKKFTESGVLQNHLRIHTGEKPFQCQICNKKFTQSGVLQNHLRIHTGEKPFQCQICNKKFTQSGVLQSHTRIHTGVKPYQCQICSYKCTQLSALKNHLRIHTGEKPYQCKICYKKFTWSSNLRSHLKNVHNEILK